MEEQAVRAGEARERASPDRSHSLAIRNGLTFPAAGRLSLSPLPDSC